MFFGENFLLLYVIALNTNIVLVILVSMFKAALVSSSTTFHSGAKYQPQTGVT